MSEAFLCDRCSFSGLTIWALLAHIRKKHEIDLPAGNSAAGPGGSAQQIAGNVTDED